MAQTLASHAEQAAELKRNQGVMDNMNKDLTGGRAFRVRGR